MNENNTMTSISLTSHIKELRKRLMVSLGLTFVGFILCFVFYEHIFMILVAPLLQIESTLGEKHLYMTQLLEGFVTKIKLSFLCALFVTSPFHLGNLLQFIFPGLKKKEKKIAFFLLSSSALLIVFSAYLTYYHIVPISIRFLTNTSLLPTDVGLLLNYQHSIYYVFYFMFYALLFFQSPIVLELLLGLNIVQRKTLLKHSRYVIISIFLIAALVTPPDFISQIAISIPMIGLYFLTIGIAKLCHFGEST